MEFPQWQYDEMRHAGTDYNSLDEVRVYDERMSRLRDTDAETKQAMDFLAPKGGEVLVEFGCGTGRLAVETSKRCKKVHAVDISPIMLKYAAEKAGAAGCGNIEFVHAGFLTYEHKGEGPHAAVSQIALHHLPDFWKQVALKRIADMLVPGGRFFLRDLVFSIPLERHEKALGYEVEEVARKGGEDFRVSFTRHLRDEYSTFDWIMEEMLYRAGFDIVEAAYGDHLIAAYGCVKRG